MIELMRAAVCPKYGSPDVLELRNVPKPAPADGEVLIRLFASSVNAYDWHKLRADTFLIRLLGGGLFKPKNPILGCDVAGRVEAVGENATKFKAGDEVYGCLADGSGDGGYAEFVCAKEKALARKPAGVSFGEAAAIPMAAVTALQGLKAGQIHAGQRVLINGASGGVGTFAVQLARAAGAVVTGVCSARNADTARSLGAGYVVDYTRENFRKSGQTYDLILDVAANCTLKDYRRCLTPGGIAVVVGFGGLRGVLKVALFGRLKAKKHGGRKIVLLAADNSDGADLVYLNGLLETGKIKPVIDASYPLEDIAKAFWRFEREHARGKIVITIAKEAGGE